MDQSSLLAVVASSGVLLISNLFGNTLVCVVILRNRNMRTPLSYLLFNLAVSDVMVGVFSIPIIMFRFVSLERKCTEWQLLRKLLARGTCIYPCGTVSALSLAAIAFERYQAVVHPLTVRQNITKRKTFVFIIITWILAICSTIPWLLGLDPDGSVPQRFKVKADYKEALKLYYYIFEAFVYGVSLVVMSIFYGQVIRYFLKEQNKIIEQRWQVTVRAKKRIILMLITVTSIFASLWTVGMVFHRVYRYTPGSLASLVLSYLVLINSSIN